MLTPEGEKEDFARNGLWATQVLRRNPNLHVPRLMSGSLVLRVLWHRPVAGRDSLWTTDLAQLESQIHYTD